MNVLFILSGSLPESIGGVEVYTHEVARALQRRGHVVSMFAAASQRDARRYSVRQLEHEGVPITSAAHRMLASTRDRLRLLFGISSMYSNRRMHDIVMRHVEQCRPDVVHVQHLVHLSSGIIRSIRDRNIPVVVTLHDYWFLCANGQLMSEGMTAHMPASCDHRCLTYLVTKERFGFAELRRARRESALVLTKVATHFLYHHYVNLRSRFFTSQIRLKRRALLSDIRAANLILAPSRFLRDLYVRAGLSPDSVVHCASGFDAGRFAGAVPRARTERPIRFAYMGRIAPEKGLHVLVKSFVFPSSEASLSIYGAPSERFPYYERYVKSVVQPGAHVVFHEPVPREKVPATYQDIDVLVFPSLWWENSPLSIRESFLTGTPVITANIGGMQELVSHGVNGLLFSCGDAADLTRKMRMVIQEPSLISRLEPDRRVKSIETHASELEEMYSSIADEH